MNTPLKLTIATLVLGSFAVATFCSASTPRAAAGGGFEISVNRTNKAERLETVVAKPSPASAPRQSSISVGRRPVGCEPAFSPLAEPARKQFFGRCVS
jgi:hypothetical protein